MRKLQDLSDKKEGAERKPASQVSLVPFEPDTDFYDIDWARVFDEMNWSYDGPIPKKYLAYLREDGTFDMRKAASEQGDWVSRYVTESGEANIDAIIAILKEHGGDMYYTPIFMAIPDSSKISVENAERIRDALMDHCNWLIKRGKYPQLFACMEQLFPIFFDSFQILEDQLPLALRTGYIEKMPHYRSGNMYGEVYDNMDDVRKSIEKEFLPEEVETLCVQARENSDAIFFFQEFIKWRRLPRKSEEDVNAYRKAFSRKMLGKVEIGPEGNAD